MRKIRPRRGIARFLGYAALVGVTTLFALTRIHVVQIESPSPSGRCVAVLEKPLLGETFIRSNLYIHRPGERRAEFVASVLNNAFDHTAVIGWKPDESELVIANNYDGSPQMVVVVKVNDTSGRVLIPANCGVVGPEQMRGYMTDVVRTKHTLRMPSAADLTWLKRVLSGKRGERGDFFDVLSEEISFDAEESPTP